MPFRTRRGSHYHMIKGCHRATIPCGTEGLTPCADCCGSGTGGAFPATTGQRIGSGLPGGTTGTGFFGNLSDADHAPSHGGEPTSDFISRLKAVLEADAIASTHSQAPSPMPPDFIAKMISTGLFSSVDLDTTTGVISFKVNGNQAGPAPDGATVGSQGTTTEPSGSLPNGQVVRDRDYDSTDTGDVIREIRGGRHNSLERYLRSDGTLTPEREEVHRRIIDDILSSKTPVQGQATFRMLGGGPASGKSSVVKGGCVEALDSQSTVDVDSDLLKTMLPGYADMAAATPNAAAFYHEESSALAKRLMRVAFGENYNVTLDGTGNGSSESVRRKIGQARKAGYRVSAVYVTVDIDTAIDRNEQRYRRLIASGQQPRRVPPQYVVNIHKSVSAILPDVAADFDDVVLYDNSGPMGSVPILIASGGSGEPLVPAPGREREFFAFLHKR